jgi:hypothetical protein
MAQAEYIAGRLRAPCPSPRGGAIFAGTAQTDEADQPNTDGSVPDQEGINQVQRAVCFDSYAGVRRNGLTGEAEEFIRRFLLHVVPGGFVRIRHFGFLANRTRRAKLARCRALLGPSPSPAGAPIESVSALMLRLTGIDIERCPLCHQGRLHVTEILPPSPPTRGVPLVDTS